jgi:hypothetical protein
LAVKVSVAGAVNIAKCAGVTVSQGAEVSGKKVAVPSTRTVDTGAGMPGLQLHVILAGETEIESAAVERRGGVAARVAPTGVATGGPTVSVTLIVAGTTDPPGIEGVIVTVAL